MCGSRGITSEKDILRLELPRPCGLLSGSLHLTAINGRPCSGLPFYRAQMRTAGLLWILLWSVHGTAPGGVSGSAERVGSGDTDGKGVLKVEVDQTLGGDLNLLATSDGIGTGA